jgi:hypothetical protein
MVPGTAEVCKVHRHQLQEAITQAAHWPYKWLGVARDTCNFRLQRCMSASPVHRRNFVRQIRIAFGNNHLQALAKNEG